MSASSTSRQQLKIGTVFFHREFEGHDGEIKDRYFVVVSIDEANFHCFTACTSLYLRTERFSHTTSCFISRGSTCLPKDCVIDCRFLYSFDDIVMSNKLNNRNASVSGCLPSAIIRSIYRAVSNSKILEKKKKLPILESLESYLLEANGA
jgi:hypothetical protein